MMKRTALILFILSMIYTTGYAQPGNDKVYDLADAAEKMYKRGAYDSAISVYSQALELVKKQDIYKDVIATILMSAAGDAWQKKNNAQQAHHYYTLALHNARKHNHKSEIIIVLPQLMTLHRQIARQDLSFDYPLVAETVEENIFVELGDIKANGDSMDVTIPAGKNDGIILSSISPQIYTHITVQDTIGHNEINFYSAGRIVDIGNNKALVRAAKNEKIKLLPGDFVVIRAQVPLRWQKLSLRDFLLRNLFFRDNYNQRLFDYRYFFHFADSTLEAEVLDLALFTVQEVLEAYGKDTLTNEQFSAKAATGIFAGHNVMKAISLGNHEHLRYFLDFVASFPGKYTGNNFKFSETYATWLLNNTPLTTDDMKAWLLSFPEGERRQRKAYDIRDQLIKENLADRLLDEGMRQVKIEDIRSARQTAQLVRDITTGTNDNSNAGWSDYLFANIEQRMARPANADSLLTIAASKFSATNNKEGLRWVNSTRDEWKRNREIIVGVQNGHLFPYIIAEPADSRYFASGGKDNLIKIWDKTLGKEILTLNEHRDEINSLQYSPNGRYLVSASADSTICVWNAYNYALLYKYRTQGEVRSAIFSPDNKYIVCAGEGNVIRFRDLHTGEVVKELALHKGRVLSLDFHPQVASWLYSASTDSLVYKWDTETGEMIRWYRQKGKVLEVKLSANGKYISTLSTDSLFTIWDAESHSKLLWGQVHTYKPGNLAFYASGSFSPDSRYFAYPFRKDSFNIIDLKDFYQRVYPTNQPAQYLNLADMVFSKDGTSLYARFDMGGPLRIYNFAGWDIRNNTTLSSRDIRPFSNLTVGVQFTHDDNGLVILHNEVGKLDLRNANYESLYSGASLVLNNTILLKNENLGTWFSDKPATLHIYDHRKNETVGKFVLKGDAKLSSCEIAEAGNAVFLGTTSGWIYGWDLEPGKNRFGKQVATGKDEGISNMVYDSIRNRLMAVTEEGLVYILDPKTGETISIIKGINANYTAFSAKFIYVTTANGWLHKFDAITLEEINRIPVNQDSEPAYQVTVTADNRYIILQGTFSSLVTIDAATDRILYSMHDHDYGGTMIAASHDSRTMATAGFDSRINLIDIATGKRKVSINMPMDRGPVITDTNGHYLAARNALDAVTFSFNNNAYSFDQFDLQLNRPDIILSRIGRADSALLRSYHLAYEKRLKKLGMKEVKLSADMHLPFVRIRDRFTLQPATIKQTFELEIECSDSRYNLRSLQVLVNNSPIFGIAGKDLRALNTMSIVEKVTIPLSEGVNDIKVYCTNEQGVTSLNEAISITSKYKPARPGKVYFIGIGIAEYRDKRMNLGYSVKDIRDLARMFDRLYLNLEVDTLMNEKVTKENILALKKKLLQTTVNDRIILAVTGHGLLSDSLDFYYATWDVDFSKPGKRGLKYEELENLLTDIPARQKLMLIDACHSGALDKEELLALKTDTVSQVIMTAEKDKNVKGRAPRGLIKKSSEATMNANSSFEMMQRLFSDLSAGNGAVIISAAGGMEYAFESGKWNNGVFTYCVRKGIEEKLADIDGGNFDGRVSVQELLKYVSRKVSELTDGKQRPTSRRENVEYEWMIRN